jgi:purine-nucleoside phosphorylase
MTMSPEFSKLKEGEAFVRSSVALRPRVALLLGSGLGSLVDRMEVAARVRSDEIPHFPRCTVKEHAGEVAFGRLEGIDCVAYRGRFHLYEGYSGAEIVRPVRLARLLGAEILVVTNAAGGIHPNLSPGDLMALTDHLNLSGANACAGDNVAELGPRFHDMSAAYCPELRAMALAAAKAENVPLAEGVYAGLSGPSFETPAEIRMLQALGADAVGMSTVNEVIAARHAGLRVLGISCITNKAAGLSKDTLSHEEVIETTNRFNERNKKVISGFLKRLAAGSAS